jgi:hypothetical protein
MVPRKRKEREDTGGHQKYIVTGFVLVVWILECKGLEVLQKVGSIFQYLACSDGHFTMQIHTGKM